MQGNWTEYAVLSKTSLGFILDIFHFLMCKTHQFLCWYILVQTKKKETLISSQKLLTL